MIMIGAIVSFLLVFFAQVACEFLTNKQENGR